jgi:hypothetical protein
MQYFYEIVHDKKKKIIKIHHIQAYYTNKTKHRLKYKNNSIL